MTTEPTTNPTPVSRGPSVKQMAVVVVILGAGILVTALTSDVTKMSEPGIKLVPSVISTNGVTLTNEVPFLPDRAGEWEGGELQGLTKEEKAILPQDTGASRRVYRNKAGEEIHCSVILAGKDVTSIHRSEVCLPGQGLIISSEQVETIPMPAVPGGQLQVTRMNGVKTLSPGNGQSARMYYVFAYWFVGKDRLTPHHGQRILWTTKDRVLHNRNHRWAYFLIYSLVKDVPSEQQLKPESDAAMRSIQNFVEAIFPLLLPDAAAKPR